MIIQQGHAALVVINNSHILYDHPTLLYIIEAAAMLDIVDLR